MCFYPARNLVLVSSLTYPFLRLNLVASSQNYLTVPIELSFRDRYVLDALHFSCKLIDLLAL